MKINNPAWTENNKFFLEKVMLVFRNAMKHHSAPKTCNLYEIDEENKFKEEQVVNEKSSFDKQELKKFLFDFGFVLYDFSEEKLEKGKRAAVEFAVEEEENKIMDENFVNNKNKNEDNVNINNIKSDNIDINDATINALKGCDSSKKHLSSKKEKVDLKGEEHKLINLFVDSVFQENIGEAATISSNDLFLYVIGILSLFDYFIYSSYKKSNPLQAKKDKLNTNNSKKSTIIGNKHKKLPKTEEEISLKNQIIQEIKQEISKKAHKHTRYVSFDSENNLMITDENANSLKKDFHMFYLNFMFRHNIKNNRETLKLEVENEFKQNVTFKPKIDENSKKLYSDYRRKILVSDSFKPASVQGARAKEKEINEYIDGLILRKKKKEK